MKILKNVLKKAAYLLVPLLLGAFPGVGQVRNRAFDALLKSMLKQSVPAVSVTTLAAEMKAGNPPLLLDTREKREYDVSHLPAARWVGYDTFTLETMRQVPKNQPIVVYCSIGVRSEKVGEKLRAAGFTQVRNLYGSIFEWVNQGHPVVQGTQPTPQVHAYSRVWGVWLQRGQKVYE